MDNKTIVNNLSKKPAKEDEKVSTDLSTGKKILLPPQITLNFEPSIVLRKKVANNQ